MKKALEGLTGVTGVEMDLEHDLFRVRYTQTPDPAPALATIRNLGYSPTLAAAADFHVHGTPLHPVGEPAALIRDAIARARASSKRFVLVDCMGDN